MARENLILFSVSETELKTLIADVVSEQLQKHGNAQQQVQTTNIYLTRKETARKLGVTLPTLSNWTKDGTIQGKRIGSRIRYCIEDIESALKDIHNLKYKKK